MSGSPVPDWFMFIAQFAIPLLLVIVTGGIYGLWLLIKWIRRVK